MLVYLSIGSNLQNKGKDKESNIDIAVNEIGKHVGDVVRRSRNYYSEPWGFQSANIFVNCCIAVETLLTPLELLHTTQQIEKRMGRHDKTVKQQYTDRIIDIDILLYGDETINLPELQIPHPLMHERRFVMIPLAEIKEK